MDLDISANMLRKQCTIFGSWVFSTMGPADCARFVANASSPSRTSSPRTGACNRARSLQTLQPANQPQRRVHYLTVRLTAAWRKCHWQLLSLGGCVSQRRCGATCRPDAPDAPREAASEISPPRRCPDHCETITPDSRVAGDTPWLSASSSLASALGGHAQEVEPLLRGSAEPNRKEDDRRGGLALRALPHDRGARWLLPGSLRPEPTRSRPAVDRTRSQYLGNRAKHVRLLRILHTLCDHAVHGRRDGPSRTPACLDVLPGRNHHLHRLDGAGDRVPVSRCRQGDRIGPGLLRTNRVDNDRERATAGARSWLSLFDRSGWRAACGVLASGVYLAAASLDWRSVILFGALPIVARILGRMFMRGFIGSLRNRYEPAASGLRERRVHRGNPAVTWFVGHVPAASDSSRSSTGKDHGFNIDWSCAASTSSCVVRHRISACSR